MVCDVAGIRMNMTRTGTRIGMRIGMAVTRESRTLKTMRRALLDSEDLYDRNCPMGMMECPTTGDCIENEQRSATERYKSNPLLLLHCY